MIPMKQPLFQKCQEITGLAWKALSPSARTPATAPGARHIG
jgi:hypothetical protein